MIHGSETEDRRAEFLYKDFGTRSPEARFDASPMRRDARALNASVERMKGGAGPNIAAMSRFSALIQSGVEGDVVSRAYSSGGGVLKAGSLISLLVASGLFIAAEIFKVPGLYLVGAILTDH